MTPRKVLILDDEPYVLEALRRLLELEGYEVWATTSAAEALTMIPRIGSGAVISDQRMPDMTGTEFLTHVRKTSPETWRILLTSPVNLDAIRSAIANGTISLYLQKPWNDGELLKSLNHCFVEG